MECCQICFKILEKISSQVAAKMEAEGGRAGKVPNGTPHFFAKNKILDPDSKFSFNLFKKTCKTRVIMMVKLARERGPVQISNSCKFGTRYMGIKPSPHSLISTFRSTVHTNPSRKRSLSKTLSKPEELQNAGFASQCGRKTS